MRKKSALISAIYVFFIVLFSEYLLSDSIRLYIELPVLVIGIIIIDKIVIDERKKT